MTSQCHNHHDIIMYPLINKEFLIKKFPIDLTPIIFCLIPTSFHFQDFQQPFSRLFAFTIMPKNSRTSRKTHYRNTSQAENRQQKREEAAQRQEEIDRLRGLLTRALDQLAIHDTEVSRLERELTLHSFSSENIIRSWQVRYHLLQESYFSLRRNIEELRHQHQEEVEEMGREHS